MSWNEALTTVAERLARIRAEQGPEAIGVLGGARLSNEDAYAWAKLAKSVIGTDSVDAQLGDGLPAEVVLALPRATIDEACAASCVVVLSGDLREELPVCSSASGVRPSTAEFPWSSSPPGRSAERVRHRRRCPTDRARPPALARALAASGATNTPTRSTTRPGARRAGALDARR